MGPQVCHRTASLKRALITALISTVLGCGTMMTQIGIGQISCPAYPEGHACTAFDNNPCSSGGCYTVRSSNEFYCTDKKDDDGNPARVQSQRVINAKTDWKRCRSYTPTAMTTGTTSGYVYKSCAENLQDCGTTQNYQIAPVETGYCQELDRCNSTWTRLACASFRSDECFPKP